MTSPYMNYLISEIRQVNFDEDRRDIREDIQHLFTILTLGLKSCGEDQLREVCHIFNTHQRSLFCQHAHRHLVIHSKILALMIFPPSYVGGYHRTPGGHGHMIKMKDMAPIEILRYVKNTHGYIDMAQLCGAAWIITKTCPDVPLTQEQATLFLERLDLLSKKILALKDHLPLLVSKILDKEIPIETLQELVDTLFKEFKDSNV